MSIPAVEPSSPPVPVVEHLPPGREWQQPVPEGFRRPLVTPEPTKGYPNWARAPTGRGELVAPVPFDDQSALFAKHERMVGMHRGARTLRVGVR